MHVSFAREPALGGHLVCVGGARVLVDCALPPAPPAAAEPATALPGMAPGSAAPPPAAPRPPLEPPIELDCVVAASSDGLLGVPRLRAAGYTGPVLATRAALALARLQIQDARLDRAAAAARPVSLAEVFSPSPDPSREEDDDDLQAQGLAFGETVTVAGDLTLSAHNAGDSALLGAANWVLAAGGGAGAGARVGVAACCAWGAALDRAALGGLDVLCLPDDGLGALDSAAAREQALGRVLGEVQRALSAGGSALLPAPRSQAVALAERVAAWLGGAAVPVLLAAPRAAELLRTVGGLGDWAGEAARARMYAGQPLLPPAIAPLPALAGAAAAKELGARQSVVVAAAGSAAARAARDLWRSDAQRSVALAEADVALALDARLSCAEAVGLVGVLSPGAVLVPPSFPAARQAVLEAGVSGLGVAWCVEEASVPALRVGKALGVVPVAGVVTAPGLRVAFKRKRVEVECAEEKREEVERVVRGGISL